MRRLPERFQIVFDHRGHCERPARRNPEALGKSALALAWDVE
jgi:hypothetical protein